MWSIANSIAWLRGQTAWTLWGHKCHYYTGKSLLASNIKTHCNSYFHYKHQHLWSILPFSLLGPGIFSGKIFLNAKWPPLLKYLPPFLPLIHVHGCFILSPPSFSLFRVILAVIAGTQWEKRHLCREHLGSNLAVILMKAAPPFCEYFCEGMFAIKIAAEFLGRNSRELAIQTAGTDTSRYDCDAISVYYSYDN